MQKTTAYRYSYELLILFITLALVAGIIALTAAATVCLSGVFVVAIVALSYFSNRAHHASLLSKAYAVTPESSPALASLVRVCQARLQPGKVDTFITPNPQLNAYTFGLTEKVVVLYSSLLKVMDAEELQFIIGHELGHVSLGHTWLNTLIGGMAGIPAPFGAAVALTAAFLWWNRFCEYSADRAGLLACGSLPKAVTALIRLEIGPGLKTQEQLAEAYRLVDAEDDNPLNMLSEVLSSHPMIIKRITMLRKYAGSADYKRLQALVNRNLV